MAIVNPQFVMVDRGQTVTITVNLSDSTNASAWTVSAILRAYNGGTALATKTVGSGIASWVSGTGWVITFTTSDTNLTPGAYVWDMRRTDSGAEFQIVEPSAFVVRDNATTGSPTITNLSEYIVHAWNNLDLSSQPALASRLQQVLYAAEDHIKRWCNREFVYKSSQTEYYDGTGTPHLHLKRFPVSVSSGITSVKLDWSGNYGTTSDSFASGTALTSGEDYALVPDGTSLMGDGNCSGILYRIGGVWPLRVRRSYGRLAGGLEGLPGCIQVVYAGGFQLMPRSLKEAVWDVATYMHLKSTSGRLAMSESGEGYSVAYAPIGDDAKMIGSVQSVINTFQNLYPG